MTVYEGPAAFVSLTHSSLNLRELVLNVVLRLAGRTGRVYRKASTDCGGGKTHMLTALQHSVHGLTTMH